tara:strand:- start:4302 stop:4673 length:372 start_codon:yes stop_codon:yes gene_type:complete
MTLQELLKLHDETHDKCRKVMEIKNNDYTGGKEATDIFANFKSSQILGVHPVTGILMRIIDKLQRIKTFANDGVLSVPDESVEDACEDIVNYAILAKAMLLESREGLRKQKVKREVEEIVKKG